MLKKCEFSSHPRLSRQLSGGCELTVVLHDFTAGCSTEISVSTGERNRPGVLHVDSSAQVVQGDRLYALHLQARRWSCWSGPASGPAGVWSGPRTAARHRRAWCPAPPSACPTPAPVWRWTASSAPAKVGERKALVQIQPPSPLYSVPSAENVLSKEG